MYLFINSSSGTALFLLGLGCRPSIMGGSVAQLCRESLWVSSEGQIIEPSVVYDLTFSKEVHI